MSINSSVSADGLTLTIQIEGRFAYAVHEEFRAAYHELEEKPKKVVVDMSGADYLDSSALGMLLMLREHFSGDGSGISIEGTSSEIQRIFKVANFDQLFTLK